MIVNCLKAVLDQDHVLPEGTGEGAGGTSFTVSTQKVKTRVWAARDRDTAFFVVRAGRKTVVLCCVKVRAQTAHGQCRGLQRLLEDVEDGVGCRQGPPKERPMWLGPGGLAIAADSAGSDQHAENRLRARLPVQMSMEKSERPFDAPTRRLPLWRVFKEGAGKTPPLKPRARGRPRSLVVKVTLEPTGEKRQ